MNIRTVRIVLVGKLLLAAVALVALVVLPARPLVPSVSLDELVLYVAAGVAGAFVLLVVAAICSQQFAQFILRMGGTGPQWFWFLGEPPRACRLAQGESGR